MNSTLALLVTLPMRYNYLSLNELQKVGKWLDLNQLCLNVAKSKFMLHVIGKPQKVIPNLQSDLNGSPIDFVHAFNFLAHQLIAILVSSYT